MSEIAIECPKCGKEHRFAVREGQGYHGNYKCECETVIQYKFMFLASPDIRDLNQTESEAKNE